MHRSRYVILLGVPLSEMVCGQIQGLWAPSIGSLSLAQLFHCFMLCVVSLYLVSLLRRSSQWPLPITACIAPFLLVSGVSTVLALKHNGHVREDIVAFSQILYWFLMWLVYVAECGTVQGRRLALTGVFAAGVYMAVSIILLHVIGGAAYSRYDEVDASFGGFSTAKSLGGILCVAALLSLRVKSPLLQIALVCASLMALMLTYQRAGQLAMLAATLWVVALRIRSGSTDLVASARFVIGVACALVVIAGVVDTEGIATRWKNADVTLGDKAGSGRLGLWTDACHAFESMDGFGKILGVGYSGMRDAMLQEGMGGNRKHTHSDVLDILLGFGLLGILGWAGVHCATIQTLRTCPKTSMDYALGGAVYIVFLIESLVTGQVFGPATMIVYLGAITGLCGTGSESSDMDDATGAFPCAGDAGVPRCGHHPSGWLPEVRTGGGHCS